MAADKPKPDSPSPRKAKSTAKLLEELKAKKQRSAAKQTAPPPVRKPVPSEKPKSPGPPPQPREDADRPEPPRNARLHALSRPSAPPGRPVARPMRPGKAPDTPLPRLNYEKIKAILARRKAVSLMVLFILAGLTAAGIAALVNQYAHRGDILRNANMGLTALEENRLDGAQAHFERALELYRAHNTGIEKHLWFNDGSIETVMMRVAHGWRSLGRFEPGLEIYREVWLRNTYGPHSWLGQLIHQSMFEFIQPAHWTESELREMRETLLQTDPYSWGEGAIGQIRLTEWVTLLAIPAAERFERADIVILGIPAPDPGFDGEHFNLEAQFFYKDERMPGRVAVRLPDPLSENELQRIRWYAESGFKCLVFGSVSGNRIALNGMEGINLSENPFVEAFNEALNRYTEE